MEGVLISLLFVHVILYLAWKITAIEEKNSRPYGRKIPTYATGGLGNLVGFSLMTTGVGFIDSSILNLQFLLPATVAAIVITVVLHYYWKMTAKGTVTSLYYPNGEATLAGVLHLIYVFFISIMVVAFLLEITKAELVSLLLFTGGATLYGLAVIIDKKRGVI